MDDRNNPEKDNKAGQKAFFEESSVNKKSSKFEDPEEIKNAQQKEIEFYQQYFLNLLEKQYQNEIKQDEVNFSKNMRELSQFLSAIPAVKNPANSASETEKKLLTSINNETRVNLGSKGIIEREQASKLLTFMHSLAETTQDNALKYVLNMLLHVYQEVLGMTLFKTFLQTVPQDTSLSSSFHNLNK